MTWEMGQPVRIESSPYIVRSLKPSDVETYSRWHNDPDLQQLAALPRGFGLEQHQRVLEFADDRSRFLLGVCVGPSEQLIGFCKINVDTNHKRAHFMLVIGDNRQQGKRVTQTILPALHQFMFEQLLLHKVTYEVRANNAKALHLLSKYGVTQEVVYQQHERTQNTYVDVIGFGLLREEWLAMQLEQSKQAVR